VGLGDSVKVAQKHAYDAADLIHFAGSQMRRDIGWRALKR
jgi:phosphoribosylamine--glycine ligase